MSIVRGLYGSLYFGEIWANLWGISMEYDSVNFDTADRDSTCLRNYFIRLQVVITL